ncbi:MAG: hypothetical protein QNK30_01330 [Bacteroidales bacterium]|nr:hypothetical protein [Bacteroidales bacterium]
MKISSRIFFTFFLLSLFIFSCSTLKNKEKKAVIDYPKGSFGYDLNFLKRKDDLVVLRNSTEMSQVIISPKYQAKIFTSTAQGDAGKSFGWINYDLLSKDTILDHMNPYGSENRFWIGPEGGQFSVFFTKNSDMTIENWYTPAAIDTEPWTLDTKTEISAHLIKDMQLTNSLGTKFKIKVNRDIFLLDEGDVKDMLRTEIGNGIDWVAYKTVNKITNTGQQEWTRETGTISIWILDMFAPGENITVVIPFVKGDMNQLGPIATTNYFGEIPSERLKFGDQTIFFKTDGKKRSKLGLAPGRAKPVAGSYDEDNKVLTIIHYSIPAGIVEYVNQMWTWQEYPFIGDVLNSYNDGPLEDGSQMGPFYELESSSPAAFLAPGGSMTHIHSVFHFVGEDDKLNMISKSVLSVGIDEIKAAF